jgi:hypothetical protein
MRTIILSAVLTAIFTLCFAQGAPNANAGTLVASLLE